MKPDLMELADCVVKAGCEVHAHLGPGFLESVYKKAVCHELEIRRIPFQEEVLLPVSYKGKLVGKYKADLIVDGKMIVELKAISQLTPAHVAQAQNYLAATELALAVLLNFGAAVLEHVHVKPSKLPACFNKPLSRQD